jgi:DNA-binding CsgD family transcriptional regulator/tetratricopeptide (TPR) repeat protein/type II secretory pathway predicted ATPase ExeA
VALGRAAISACGLRFRPYVRDHGAVPATHALLERSEQLEALDERLHSPGRLVLVAGEAGIGKTALVRAFSSAHPELRVLWGACDALYTPRALGPLLDIADEAGGELAAALAEDVSPSRVVQALVNDLRGGSVVIVVLEDLHWADEATLDVVRLLARRIDTLPALLLVTYRDDELDPAHPLRILLGELTSRTADRIRLEPLSPDAVAELAGEGADNVELHQRTGGNPFYVTEVLAAGGEIPDTVRDAVLARAARLDPGGRALLDLVAIVPSRAELWLLQALTDLDDLDACLASGVLRAERDAIGFRHEIARVAVEQAIPPHRTVLLHRRVLHALGDADPARLAHHAEAAGDGGAVLRYAPAAGERAAALGSHREAAAQFARALRSAPQLEPERRAALLERRSYECYLTDRVADAIEARRAALEEHRAAGNQLAEGDAHRWLSRLAWFSGDNPTAEREAELAVELLEPLPPGRELAMAYSNMSQLRMLASDLPAATEWGARAMELAESLEETEILVHALNNMGTSGLMANAPEARELLERSLALALDAGLEEHVARAYTNLGTVSVSMRDYPRADDYLRDGIAYCAERDLDAWLLYMTGYLAMADLDQGRWDDCAANVSVVLTRLDAAAPSRITPLAALGRLRARRGDPGSFEPLDEALELALGTGEVQRLGPVAAARAEAHWLAGEDEQIAAETDAALALALEHDDAWAAGELCAWRRRADIADDVPRDAIAQPYRLELEDAAHVASALWGEKRCAYDAALALAHCGVPRAQRRALAELQAMGARPAARRVERALRGQGIRDLRRGPRATTRENPAGLTAREVDVVALLADGLRNAEIAARLFVTEKTVAHHVSAILRKLDVKTRGQAGAEAARLGIVER